jgi:hypothetical protein
VWYVNHACNVDWESTGSIQEVRISIARRMTSLWSWTELARGIPDAGALALSKTSGYYYREPCSWYRCFLFFFSLAELARGIPDAGALALFKTTTITITDITFVR